MKTNGILYLITAQSGITFYARRKNQQLARADRNIQQKYTERDKINLIEVEEAAKPEPTSKQAPAPCIANQSEMQIQCAGRKNQRVQVHFVPSNNIATEGDKIKFPYLSSHRNTHAGPKCLVWCTTAVATAYFLQRHQD